jgi:hypothetical protein
LKEKKKFVHRKVTQRWHLQNLSAKVIEFGFLSQIIVFTAFFAANYGN